MGYIEPAQTPSQAEHSGSRAGFGALVAGDEELRHAITMASDTSRAKD